MAIENAKVLMNGDVIVSYKHLQTLYEQRADLLEALKYARQELHNIGNDEGWGEIDYPIINQAITKAEAAE